MDYMLFHNLYFLFFDNGAFDPKVHWNNMQTAIIDNPWPYFHAPSLSGNAQNLPFAYIGSANNPEVIRTTNSIQSNSIINGSTSANQGWTNGDVTYRAGDSIVLIDGFEVQPGARFEAFIQPLKCIQGNIQRVTAPSNENVRQPQLFLKPNNSSEANPPEIDQFLLEVSPIPTTDLLQINLLGRIDSKIRIQIFADDGREVFRVIEALQNENTFHTEISVGDLPQGTYFILVASTSYVLTKTIAIAR